jgi:hypothetical protein
MQLDSIYVQCTNEGFNLLRMLAYFISMFLVRFIRLVSFIPANNGGEAGACPVCALRRAREHGARVRSGRSHRPVPWLGGRHARRAQ